jgi:F-type H+-transporting ATPase subunit epsilon
MDSIRLDVVTAERSVYSDDVDIVIAPVSSVSGHYAAPHPLMTMLQPGELIARKARRSSA